MGNIFVLVVDDDYQLQQIAKLELQSCGMTVFTAADTHQADAILKYAHVDAIVCDVAMLGEDGFSWCQRLRRDGNQVPVLFLSAFTDPKTIHLGYEAGGTGFIAKPFEIDTLCRSVLNAARPPTQSAA